MVDLTEECYCSEDGDRIWIPPHRANTTTGAMRQARKFIRDCFPDTESEYLEKVRQRWAVVQTNQWGERWLHTYLPVHMNSDESREVTPDDDGAELWWEVSW